MEYKNISSDLSLRSAATWTGDTVIRGCVSFIQDGQTHVEEVSEHAEFWGVYLPQNDGRTMWYSDHDTKAQAEFMAENMKSVGPVDQERLFQVIGSGLGLLVDSVSGKIVRVDTSTGEDREMVKQIDHIDVDEALSWVKTYQANDLKKLAGECFDVLAVGYWNKDGSYIEPELEYRQEITERYWQNKSPFLVLITDQDNEVIATLNTHFNQNSTLSFEPKRPGELSVSDDAFSGLCYSMQIEVNDALQNGGTFILTENGDWQWPHEAENKTLPEYAFRVTVDDSLPLNQDQEAFASERDIPTLDEIQCRLSGSGLSMR